MKTKITQNPNIISFKRFANNIVTKRKAMSLFLILFSLFWMPKSVNAFEISAIKAPLDGDEIMKKYSIVRAVDDDGYVVAGSTPSTHFLGQMSVHVMKFNDNGNIDWSFYYNIPNLSRNFETTHIDYNVDSNGYVMCGYTDAEPTLFGHSSIIPFILEIDDVGAVQRNTTIHLEGVFFKVKPTPKGDYIAVGYSGDTTLAGFKVGMCVKFNSSLTSQWIYAYIGQSVYSTSTRFFDGLQAVHVVYDGVNETYVLGGNSTGAFDINLTPNFIPVIELIELNETGGVIDKYSFMPHNTATSSPFNNVYGIDIIVQDLVVVEDPLSPYYGDVFLMGQEITMGGYGTAHRGTNYQLCLMRFKRNSFNIDSEIIHLEADVCFGNHFCRGNNIKYLEDHLIVFGTFETSGTGNYIQIPFVSKIHPSLPIYQTACDPSPYPCIFFSDGTTTGESYYYDYRLQFPDWLGTSPPLHPTRTVQVYGQSLGYADLDDEDNLRYGIVSNKKVNLTDPLWSLFVVSNTDNYFCDGTSGHLRFEYQTDYLIDTFTHYEALSTPYSESLNIDDEISDFTPIVCETYNPLEFLWPIISDGSAFEELGIKNQSDEKRGEISYYPNPALEEIRLKGVKEGDNLKIRDINGKLINEIIISNPIVDLSQLTSGVYIIQISRNQEIIFTGKLIK